VHTYSHYFFDVEVKRHVKNGSIITSKTRFNESTHEDHQGPGT
jgi:hypothetical protein